MSFRVLASESQRTGELATQKLNLELASSAISRARNCSAASKSRKNGLSRGNSTLVAHADG